MYHDWVAGLGETSWKGHGKGEDPGKGGAGAVEWGYGHGGDQWDSAAWKGGPGECSSLQLLFKLGIYK